MELLKACKCKIHRTDLQARRSSRRQCCHVESRGSLGAEFFGSYLSFLLGSSADWMVPTHIMKVNLLYSKSMDSMLIASKHLPLQQHQECCLPYNVALGQNS